MLCRHFVVAMVEDKAFQVQENRVRRAFDKAAPSYESVALLQQTVVERLLESFDFLQTNTGSILDLGSGTGTGSRLLKNRFAKANIVQLDLSPIMLQQSRKHAPRFFSRERFICGDANQLPFKDGQFDIVFSNLMLQWCVDLETVFTEVQRVLRPGGVYVFSTFGPDSLKELRESWRQVDDGVHVNTFIDMHDVGDALMRNGLHSPVLSVEHLRLLYDDVTMLMRELKSIGAQNINVGRRKTLTGKGRLQKMIMHYEVHRAENKLPATYEVIYGHAWRGERNPKATSAGVEQTISVESLKDSLVDSRSRRT